jgi:rhodanese-related sulfurtransferase
MDGEISADELRSLLDEGGDANADGHDGSATGGDLRIVDIRNPESFARGHIPGSENVPAPELTDRVEELDDANRVVTVCPHGQASVQAARLVGSYQGVDGPVESLDGGLEAWDGPIVTDKSAGGTGSDDDTSGADGSPAPF